MSFDEKIAALIQRLPKLVDHLYTEEATKNALVMPFIAAILPYHSIDRVYALEILKYHTDRNYIAQKSHRKKTIAEANLLKIKVSL